MDLEKGGGTCSAGNRGIGVQRLRLLKLNTIKCVIENSGYEGMIKNDNRENIAPNFGNLEGLRSQDLVGGN